MLLSFGTGHAIFRSKFGFITLAFLSLFIYFIYFQIQGAQWSIIAILSFIAGIAYAYRESSEGMLDDWSYRVREFLASVKSKLSIKRSAKQSGSQPYQKPDDYQQAYEAEQARREQEAKAQREQYKNQQQEESQQKQEKSKQEREKQQYQRQQKKKESIEKNKPAVDTRTNLEILGLKTGFTQEELKRAYKRKTMKTHPDKWEQESAHIQKMMEEEFKLIKKAYEALKSVIRCNYLDN